MEQPSVTARSHGDARGVTGVLPVSLSATAVRAVETTVTPRARRSPMKGPHLIGSRLIASAMVVLALLCAAPGVGAEEGLEGPMKAVGPVIVAGVFLLLCIFGEGLVYERLVGLPRPEAYLTSLLANVLSFILSHVVGDLIGWVTTPLGIALELGVLLAVNWRFERRGRMLLAGAIANVVIPLVAALLSGVVAAMLIVAASAAGQR